MSLPGSLNQSGSSTCTNLCLARVCSFPAKIPLYKVLLELFSSLCSLYLGKSFLSFRLVSLYSTDCPLLARSALVRDYITARWRIALR